MVSDIYVLEPSELFQALTRYAILPAFNSNQKANRWFPAAQQLCQDHGVPAPSAIPFQFMRRSLGTHLPGLVTLKDTQAALPHASVTTTGNVYVQVIEASVVRAVSSYADSVLEGGRPDMESLGLRGRNFRGLPASVDAAEASVNR